MITLKEFMEIVDYRITEGSAYGWLCYGANAYTLDSWDGEQDGHSFSIIFDTSTQEVYEVQAHDYRNQRAYRLINPKHKDAHSNEASERDVNIGEAWDDVDYVDLEVDDDWIQKASAIEAGEDYDVRVTVPLDLPDDVLFDLMKRAHERDLTLNQMVEEILQTAIDDVKMRDEYDFSNAEPNPLFADPPFPIKKSVKKKHRKSKQ